MWHPMSATLSKPPEHVGSVGKCSLHAQKRKDTAPAARDQLSRFQQSIGSRADGCAGLRPAQPVTHFPEGVAAVPAYASPTAPQHLGELSPHPSHPILPHWQSPAIPIPVLAEALQRIYSELNPLTELQNSVNWWTLRPYTVHMQGRGREPPRPDPRRFRGGRL
jgi:hypothetical protein